MKKKKKGKKKIRKCQSASYIRHNDYYLNLLFQLGQCYKSWSKLCKSTHWSFSVIPCFSNNWNHMEKYWTIYFLITYFQTSFYSLVSIFCIWKHSQRSQPPTVCYSDSHPEKNSLLHYFQQVISPRSQHSFPSDTREAQSEEPSLQTPFLPVWCVRPRPLWEGSSH